MRPPEFEATKFFIRRRYIASLALVGLLLGTCLLIFQIVLHEQAEHDLAQQRVSAIDLHLVRIVAAAAQARTGHPQMAPIHTARIRPDLSEIEKNWNALLADSDVSEHSKDLLEGRYGGRKKLEEFVRLSNMVAFPNGLTAKERDEKLEYLIIYAQTDVQPILQKLLKRVTEHNSSTSTILTIAIELILLATLVVLLLIGVLIFLPMERTIIEEQGRRIDLQQQAENRSRAFEEAKALLETTLNTIDQGVAVYDKDMRLSVWSKGFERLMNFPEGWLSTDRTIEDYFRLNAEQGEYGDGNVDELVASRLAALQANFSDIKPHRYIRKRNDDTYIEIAGQPMPGGGLVTTYTDMTERVEAQQEVERLAWTDGLTGLNNRNGFRSLTLSLFNECKKQGTKAAVILVDLDRFKPINDTYGHDVGDAVLGQVAERLKDSIRKGDLAIRLGGDEFAVVVRFETDIEDIVTVAQRLLAALLSPMTIGERTLTVGASMGIAFYPDDDVSLDELLRKADFALYESKSNGRGIYSLYDAKIDLKAHTLRRLEDDLRFAIAEEQFELYYQPKVDTRTGRIIGAEALIRWNHPERGLIPPSEFVTVVERSDLVFALGAWVIRQGWDAARRWRDIVKDPHFKLAVNVSQRQFFDTSFVDLLSDMSRGEPGLVNAIELEITEEIMQKSIEEASQIMHKVSSLGYSLVIDDFGTGYSNVSYLFKLPLEKIKIDKLFIDGLMEDEQSVGIVSSMIKMGHSLKVHVVAEGVEHQKQVDILKELKCDEIQGYFYSEPVPAPDFEELLKNEVRLAWAAA